MLRLRLPADPAFVCVAREAASAQAAQAGLDDDARAAVSLAVGEACNNAAVHGTTPSTIGLRCLLSDTDFVVEIVSDTPWAEDLPPASMPDPDSENGRGRALMAALMDEVNYYVVPGGTRIHLKKHRPTK